MNAAIRAVRELLRRWLTTSPGPEPCPVCGGYGAITPCICPETPEDPR